jgi:hypothetical protein
MLSDKGDGGYGVIYSFCLLGVGTVLELSQRYSFSGHSSPLNVSNIARFIFQISISVSELFQIGTVQSERSIV